MDGITAEGLEASLAVIKSAMRMFGDAKLDRSDAAHDYCGIRKC